MWSLATVVAVLVLPQIAAAEESKTLGPPGPEMLFKLLDANHDGVISEDEIPADAPEPLKALLKAADKKRDKKVTLEEFVAAVKEHPPVMPPFGMPGMGSGMPMPGMPGGRMPPFGPGGPAVGWMLPGPSGFPQEGSLGKEPDLKTLFAKMDKNKDGKLTVEEFTEGMKKLHEEMTAHLQAAGHMPGPGMPMPPGPMPGMPMPPPPFPMSGMMSPPFPMPGMMMPHAGPGSGMLGRSMPGPHGCPSPAMAMDARLKDLEAKLKALEAKVEAKK
jgi:hypothetical protein